MSSNVASNAGWKGRSVVLPMLNIFKRKESRLAVELCASWILQEPGSFRMTKAYQGAQYLGI